MARPIRRSPACNIRVRTQRKHLPTMVYMAHPIERDKATDLMSRSQKEHTTLDAHLQDRNLPVWLKRPAKIYVEK